MWEPKDNTDIDSAELKIVETAMIIWCARHIKIRITNC